MLKELTCKNDEEINKATKTNLNKVNIGLDFSKEKQNNSTGNLKRRHRKRKEK